MLADIVASVITIMFGVVHCFAWSFHFPSETERLLWHIASLVITASPFIWLVCFTIIFFYQDDNLPEWIEASLAPLISIAAALYLAARAILLVLAFIGLRSLPSAAYETVYWTTFIPHI